MQTIKGTFRDGVIQPAEPVLASEGQSVLVTFLDENISSDASDQEKWTSLRRLLLECQVDTGISDLAQQHDHYIHGTAKSE